MRKDLTDTRSQSADLVSSKTRQDKLDVEISVEGAPALLVSELDCVLTAMKQLLELKEEGNR